MPVEVVPCRCRDQPAVVVEVCFEDHARCMAHDLTLLLGAEAHAAGLASHGFISNRVFERIAQGEND